MQRIACLAAATLAVWVLGAGAASAATPPPTLVAPVTGLVTSGPTLGVTYALAQTAAGLPTITLTPAGGSPRTFPLTEAGAGEHTATLDLTAEAIADGTYGIKVGYEDPVDGLLESATATIVIQRVTQPPPPAPPAEVPAATRAPGMIGTTVAAADRVAPSITSARLLTSIFPAARPTQARFRVSEAATVAFELRRLRRGAWVRLAASTKRAPAGAAFIRLPRGLPPGRHRLTIQATDAAGNRSAPVRLSFRVR